MQCSVELSVFLGFVNMSESTPLYLFVSLLMLFKKGDTGTSFNFLVGFLNPALSGWMMTAVASFCSQQIAQCLSEKISNLNIHFQPASEVQSNRPGVSVFVQLSF